MFRSRMSPMTSLPGIGAPVVGSRFVTFCFSASCRCESALAASFCMTSVELRGKLGDSGCDVIVMSALMVV
jgi:hypothetical protein